MSYTPPVRVRMTPVYFAWINDLRDRTARARIQVRIDRLAHSSGISDARSTWHNAFEGSENMPAKSIRKRAKTRTVRYDVAAQLRTPEEMAAYLDAWLAEAPDDVAGISRALGDIARARGMAQVARAAGLSRESLYRALSAGGNPSFATILKVTKALGVRLHAEPA